jgi:ribosomal protein S24E
MSKIISIYTCNEIIVDNDDNFISEHDRNLPHADFIVKEMCEQWNKDADDFMLDIMNKEFGNRIQSCYMKPYIDEKDKTSVAVHIVGKPGVRFTVPFKNKIWNFMSAQYSDGWGEGFFGPVNIMIAPDGTRLYVD